MNKRYMYLFLKALEIIHIKKHHISSLQIDTRKQMIISRTVIGSGQFIM